MREHPTPSELCIDYISALTKQKGWPASVHLLVGLAMLMSRDWDYINIGPYIAEGTSMTLTNA